MNGSYPMIMNVTELRESEWIEAVEPFEYQIWEWATPTEMWHIIPTEGAYNEQGGVRFLTQIQSNDTCSAFAYDYDEIERGFLADKPLQTVD